MKLCRFTLKPLSPWAGPLRSDTLYGLICWHVAENEGETACRDLLDAFRANRAPFHLSSVMPANFLPMPALPPISREDFRELAAKIGAAEKTDDILFNALRRFKKFRKAPWLSFQAWQKHKDHLSARDLFAGHLSGKDECKSRTKTAFEPHVGIDRRAGSARDAQLFFMRLTYFDAASFHLYARADDPEYLLNYLERIGEVGFGRDASTGKGRFAVELDRGFQPQSLEVEAANASMLCSVCASPDMSALNGYWRLEVKRGKTGPGYANPFKKPFLMLQEGSLLQSRLEGPFVLANINSDSRVVQILQPLALPCRLLA